MFSVNERSEKKRSKKIFFWCGVFVFGVLVLSATWSFFASKSDDAPFALADAAREAWNGVLSDANMHKNELVVPDVSATSATIGQNILKTSDEIVPDEENVPATSDAAAISTPSHDTALSGSGVTTSTPVVSSCAFPSSTVSPREIIFNEIAWMGSRADDASSSNAASKKEWIELKNISSHDVSLAGWEMEDRSKKIGVHFSAHDAIAPGGFFLLAHGSTTIGSGTGEIFSNNIPNDGDDLALLAPSCVPSDLLFAASGWPAGDNAAKKTLERDADNIGWHTSALSGGTPGEENSVPAIPAPIAPAPTFYNVMIALAGDGQGSIEEPSGGLSCGASCTGKYASGTILKLSPSAHENSRFAGWSDPCFGKTECSIKVNAPVFMTATFRSTVVPQPIPEDPSLPSVSEASASSSVPASVATSSSHPVIAALQIGGASSTNDLIRIFNPGAAPVDMTGWKLRKRAKTGADSSIRQFPEGSIIGPGRYFVWANSVGGFSLAVQADVSSTETLSPDNSIALFDGSGVRVDAVGWGSGVDQYFEGSPYPTNPDPNRLLARKIADGVLIDSDNNAEDFALQ